MKLSNIFLFIEPQQPATNWLWKPSKNPRRNHCSAASVGRSSSPSSLKECITRQNKAVIWKDERHHGGLWFWKYRLRIGGFFHLTLPLYIKTTHLNQTRQWRHKQNKIQMGYWLYIAKASFICSYTCSKFAILFLGTPNGVFIHKAVGVLSNCVKDSITVLGCPFIDTRLLQILVNSF